MRSIDGRDGKDEVPGVARGPENSAPGAGQYHDPVVAVGADIVKQFGQFAVRQKSPAQ